jgi:hypothetical protein
MTPVETFFSLKITPSAKLVALHFAGLLHPDAKDVASSPKVCAEALGISRGEYERAWRECCRRKWIVGHSPTKLTMPSGVLPRIVLAALASAHKGAQTASNAPSALVPQVRPKENDEEGSRNHGASSAGSLRRGPPSRAG